MRQHAIDLLPDALRARAQAGMRARRYAAAFAGAVALVVILSIHSRWALTRVTARLKTTENQANLVLACEAKGVELNETLQKIQLYTQLYDRMALPVQVSRLMASISNAMPESVTLERLDLIMQSNQTIKSPRSKPEEETKAAKPRVLLGELAGYASAEQDITEFVRRLENTSGAPVGSSRDWGTPPFQDVSLNYIRTRKVNEVNAHEFCLSFRIDLERRYEVVDLASKDASTSAKEVAHVTE